MIHEIQNNPVRFARLFMRLSLVTALIFVANVILGKGALFFGWKITFLLDGTPEFIVLLMTVLLFVIGALFLEHDRKNKKTQSGEINS